MTIPNHFCQTSIIFRGTNVNQLYKVVKHEQDSLSVILRGPSDWDQVTLSGRNCQYLADRMTAAVSCSIEVSPCDYGGSNWNNAAPRRLHLTTPKLHKFSVLIVATSWLSSSLCTQRDLKKENSVANCIADEDLIPRTILWTFPYHLQII